MARPLKEPGKPRKRIQPYVAADTAWYLEREVKSSGIPMGEILDQWFKARAGQNANVLGSMKAKKNTPTMSNEEDDGSQGPL